MDFEISDVKEKEIDFLMAEEFASSPSFLSIFIGEFEQYKGRNWGVTKIRRSHTDSYGESDLEIFLRDDSENCLVLLIENKISTQFQPNQIHRYNQRGEAYLRQNECDDYKIILVAPESYGYSKDELDIDARILYEDLTAWFEENADSVLRRNFKVYLLEKALEKATHGYQLVEDETAIKFWCDYWELANDIAPLLNMPKPDKKPAGSSFIYFYPSELHSELSLIHKFAYGNIDLQISHSANQIGKIRQQLTDLIPNDFHIQKAGKSVVIRTKTPVLDLNRSLQSQKVMAEKSIKKVKDLYDWYQENKELFDHII